MAQKPFWSEDIDGQEVKQETVWNVLDLVQVAASEYYRYLTHPIDHPIDHPARLPYTGADRTEDILAEVRKGILAKADPDRIDIARLEDLLDEVGIYDHRKVDGYDQ